MQTIAGRLAADEIAALAAYFGAVSSPSVDEMMSVRETRRPEGLYPRGAKAGQP
jgi:hypothetical protein